MSTITFFLLHKLKPWMSHAYRAPHSICSWPLHHLLCSQTFDRPKSEPVYGKFVYVRKLEQNVDFLPNDDPIDIRPSLDLAHDDTCQHANFRCHTSRRFRAQMHNATLSYYIDGECRSGHVVVGRVRRVSWRYVLMTRRMTYRKASLPAPTPSLTSPTTLSSMSEESSTRLLTRSVTPIKTRPDMTYNVFGGTLNPAQSNPLRAFFK